jgi:glycerol-3-phosphate acyltransferase PlsY
MILQLVLAAFVGYLIGSFPSGIYIGRLYDVDPRTVGSGRTGGTNVYRAAGPVAGILTAILDLIKGSLAILVVSYLLSDAPLVLSLAGLGAVAGHNWSLYLGFRGGAGTMTNSGVVLMLYWPAFLLMGSLALLTLRLSRIASVASMVFAISVPIAFGLAYWLGHIPPEYFVYAIGEVIMIFWALRPNIKRLLARQERIIG